MFPVHPDWYKQQQERRRRAPIQTDPPFRRGPVGAGTGHDQPGQSWGGPNAPWFRNRNAGRGMGMYAPRYQKQQDRGFSTPSQGPVPFIPSGNVYSGAGVYKPGQSGAAGRFLGGFDPSGHQGLSLIHI